MELLLAQIQMSSDPEPYIGWGTLALINAGLAQSKRRSRLAWFLVSLFIGPIATFLIVVLAPPQLNRHPNAGKPRS